MDGRGSQFFKTPPPKSKWEKFKTFVWNSETNEFFGRTAIRWIKIIVFYIIFYCFLAAFWTCMLVIFYQTLQNDEPYWKLEGGRIGSSPGLGFRPSPPEDNIDTTLIWFNSSSSKSVDYWVTNLKEYLEPYMDTNEKENTITCSSKQLPIDGKSCKFPLGSIKSECTVDKMFSYPDSQPCVLIKLNRIYNWLPEPYEGELPKDMPESLINIYTTDKVWITCDGENSADKDNIGEIEFTPSQGIPNYYFPFSNQKNYLSPFVFVQFKNPTPGVIINIECRAWAKNIKYKRTSKLGSVHIELLADL